MLPVCEHVFPLQSLNQPSSFTKMHTGIMPLNPTLKPCFKNNNTADIQTSEMEAVIAAFN
jgi:hypothetical protein